MPNKRWYTGENAKKIEVILAKYRGKKDNPLNGLTFKEILEKAIKEGF